MKMWQGLFTKAPERQYYHSLQMTGCKEQDTEIQGIWFVVHTYRYDSNVADTFTF